MDGVGEVDLVKVMNVGCESRFAVLDYEESGVAKSESDLLAKVRVALGLFDDEVCSRAGEIVHSQPVFDQFEHVGSLELGKNDVFRGLISEKAPVFIRRRTIAEWTGGHDEEYRWKLFDDSLCHRPRS